MSDDGLVNAIPPLKFRDVDEPPAVRSGADLSKIIPRRLDLEEHAFGLDPCDARQRTHPAADRRSRNMPDIDGHADTDVARRQGRGDRKAGRHFHVQDHHRCRIDLRHARNEMPNRHIRRDYNRVAQHLNVDEKHDRELA